MKRKDKEEKLDETVEDSFPASDPPSNTPVTGVGGVPDRPHDEEGEGPALPGATPMQR